MISKIFMLGCLAAVTYSLPLESLNPEGGVYAVDHPMVADYAHQGGAYDRVKRDDGVYALPNELYRLAAEDHVYEGEEYDRVKREDGVYAAQDELHGLDAADHAYEGDHERTKRATCDLLSFQSKWLTINDSACAAHCLAMFKGYKGGYCKNSICHCRK